MLDLSTGNNQTNKGVKNATMVALCGTVSFGGCTGAFNVGMGKVIKIKERMLMQCFINRMISSQIYMENILMTLFLEYGIYLGIL
jgi:hypothetical protein